MEDIYFFTVLDIQKVSTDILKAIPQNKYQECFQKFYDRLQRCIDLEGMYFE